MVSGLLMNAGIPMLLAILAGILVGALMGLFSGIMVEKLEVPAFITTLVVGQVATGFALMLGGGNSLGGFSDEYVFIGNGKLLGIPISNYITVAFVILASVIMGRTRLGTHIYALGGNEQVVRQQGISTAKINYFVFTFSGICAAVAGILLSAQMNTVHPSQGGNYQLDAVAACVIGGVNMAGGEGKVYMALVGALVIGFLRNALNLLGLHPYFQNLIVGTIIIVIVAATMYSYNKKDEREQDLLIGFSEKGENMKTATATRGQAVRSFVKKNGSVVIFLLISLIAAIFVPNFASFSNFVIIIKQSAIPIIACVGMTTVLMTGGIDLSLGYNIGLCSIMMGLLVKTWEVPIWLGVLITLAIGGVVGLVNGWCVQAIHVPAFITTLGTGYVLLGLAQIVSNGASINRLPDEFLALGKTAVGPFNTTVVICVVVCLVFYYVLHRSTYGRQLSAFGLSQPASRLSSVPPGRSTHRSM